MRFIKNNIKFLIAMILVITLGIFGITYALKIAAFNPIALNTTTGTINANVTYDSTNTSTVTSTGNMLPIADNLVTGVDVTDSRILKIKFMVSGVSSNPSNTIYDIALRDISMSSALKSKYVKWRLYKNGTLLSEGNFSPSFDVKENNRLVLTNTQQDLTTNTDTYVYLMWISEACTDDLSTCDITKNQDKLLGKIFNAQIKLEASTKTKKTLTRTALSTNSASMTITNKFSPDKLVENNNVKYRYDTTNNLMEDVDGNIRYYGANPNNYIYFNCDDYSNQSSSTCEVWRIIGVFEGKVKIMRVSQIGSLAWDQDKNIDSSKTSYDTNWSTSSLQVLLNTSYLNRTADVTYYSGYQGGATTIVKTSTIGIKDSSRDMISESMWYLRESSKGYSDVAYEYERTKGSVYSGRPTLWNGKIALAYPSDYGYAADFSQCTQMLSDYNDSTCTSNNWMKSIFTASYIWLLTPSSFYSDHVSFVSNEGFVVSNSFYSVYDEGGVVPVFYLGSELEIKSGAGSSSSPYQLSA